MNNVIEKVKTWLEKVIEHNEPVLNGDEELSDGTEDIYEGRSECAKHLLMKIKEWEAKMKTYNIYVYDIQFCKKDDNGNELLNNNGSIKLFQFKDEHDVSYIAKGTCSDDLEEIKESQDE